MVSGDEEGGEESGTSKQEGTELSEWSVGGGPTGEMPDYLTEHVASKLRLGDEYFSLRGKNITAIVDL